MKKVIVTSNGLSSDVLRTTFKQLAGRNLESKMMLYVSSAARSVGWTEEEAEREAKYVGRNLMIGKVVSIDLVEMVGEDLVNLIERIRQDLVAVYVEGGNTFALLHHLRLSGFDSILQTLVEEGVIYVGLSAGSIVAGSSIEFAVWKGNNEAGEHGEFISDPANRQGLDLCGGLSIFPHFDDTWASLVEQKVPELGHDVIVLSDGQGYVIHGEQRRRFGLRICRLPNTV
jgi:dipeptidase E